MVDVLLSEKIATLPQGAAPSITKREACDLARHLDLALPLQLSLPNGIERKARDYCAFFRQRKQEPIGAVCELEDGIYLPYPETVFLQLIKSLDAIDRAKLGYELSAAYCLGSNGTGLTSSKPLLDPARMERALLNCSMRTRELARRTSQCYLPGAESPAEINLALKLFLPVRYGGLGIRGAQLNPILELGDSCQAFMEKTHCRADVFFEKSKLDIEYDSSQWHSTEAQRLEDMKRRLALRQEGYTVISIDSQTANDPERMLELGRRIANLQKSRLFIYDNQFPIRQQALFQRLGPTFTPIERR